MKNPALQWFITITVLAVVIFIAVRIFTKKEMPAPKVVDPSVIDCSGVDYNKCHNVSKIDKGA